jgi:FKBP-type peptidyl-prolyl cis-trans isomerase FkpA
MRSQHDQRRTALLLALGAAALALMLATTGCSSASTSQAPATQPQSDAAQTTPQQPSAPAAQPVAPFKDVTELQTKDLVVGTGATAKTGDTVTVNYTGWLTDGTKFDSSYDHGQSFPFVLGQGAVITGWDKGVAGMKVGGKRELVIPPAMGYGAQGAPPAIPPNATLKFDVELLKVEPAAQ